MSAVFVRGFISVIKHRDQNQLREFISTNSPIVLSITEGKPVQEPGAGTNAKAHRGVYY